MGCHRETEVLVLAMVVMVTVLPGCGSATADQPHIIFILADDLGKITALSVYYVTVMQVYCYVTSMLLLFSIDLRADGGLSECVTRKAFGALIEL